MPRAPRRSCAWIGAAQLLAIATTGAACSKTTGGLAPGADSSSNEVCAPGGTRCSGDGVQTCTRAGQWGAVLACANPPCLAGICVGTCTPEATQCAGNAVQTCGPDQQWGDAEACPASFPYCNQGQCSTTPPPPPPPDAGCPPDASGPPPTCMEPPPPPCRGWSCQIDFSCSTPTTLTGKVFDPAGLTPLDNVAVFIPNDLATLAPIATGTSTCNTCQDAIGDYASLAATDTSGSFTLSNVPTGQGVPVTVQAGKWRRTVPVDIPDECGVNTVSMTPSANPLLRLPSNRSEGDMPQMALLTGACGRIGCFLRDVGIAASEFSSPHGGGRVDVYQGLGLDGGAPPLAGGTAGDCTGPGCPLWSSRQALEAYDLVLLDCECAEHDETKPAAAMQAMHDWLGEGGQLFATHDQATWFKNGPSDFQATADWLPAESNGPVPGLFEVDTMSSRWGDVLKEWLGDAGALDPDGGILFDPANVSASVSSVAASTVRFIYSESTTSPLVLSFDTPIGSESEPCGRVVFTDVHTAGAQQPSAAPVPTSCSGGGSSAEEKALEFLLFKQGICVEP